ncbi:hypothetical protein [Herpetosiphon geysericola]|uniref:Uncharacterized protein n=1 Tax=Herpetosiphon geysericola TaxID=70996 RepID=A0A0P6YA45_9CHLR|nr:hypothetical protein [Herpetosiphon geysericola]KPL86150.1 hypothetical protein SE18_14940 [Herpetosiphon geysericola]
MSEPIKYPFEHEGKEYEVWVHRDTTGRSLHVYKDGKRIEQAHYIFNTHEELQDIAMHKGPASAEVSAGELIRIFKEHFHRYNLDQ